MCPTLEPADPGSTQLYICDKFVDENSLKVIPTKTSVIDTNPLSQSTIVNKVIKDHSLSFSGYVFFADMMLLTFHEFGVILGLDWLIWHNVVVECKSRGVWLLTIDGNKGFILGIKCDVRNNIISVVSSRKITVKGEEAYLVYILDLTMVKEDFNQVPIVNDFPKTLKGLLGMSLNRSKEFSIGVSLRTTPISSASY
ncbi:RVP_2 domain-containing protein [Gossypium australe]|uniref:RVP_2 domain-containing protein n=1 Tax=Gossypium australe TaxID=47621 RepID=A0A5B6WSI9_9ROSI|nr:RVP_2 domain-containing protein [Gossypium australe]